MGQEIGKCCASEEIEEVIKRDGTQTLSLDNDNAPTDTGVTAVSEEPKPKTVDLL